MRSERKRNPLPNPDVGVADITHHPYLYVGVADITHHPYLYVGVADTTHHQGWALRSFPFRTFRSFSFKKENVTFFSVLF